MPVQRKQFGRRGLNQQGPTQWGSSQNEYSGNNAYASTAGAYAHAGGAAALQVAGDSGVSVTDAALQFLGFFFSFKGRIGRLGYWAISTFNSIVSVAIIFGFYASLGLNFENEAEAKRILADSSFFTVWLTVLPFFVSNVSVQVRRFHDRDVSGKWMLLWFIPIIGTILSICQGFANMFFAGTRGSNRFDTPQSQAHVFD
ncbi:DUF805 domain-containing protein [Stappia sp. BW2]|nr:DUF805 domain-containing protein [Stappia sp. BW2]